MKYFLFLSFIIFVTSCKQASKTEFHHTSKVGGHMSVEFDSKDYILLQISADIENFKLEVFHKSDLKKNLLLKSETISSKVSLNQYTSDLEQGYLFAIISGKLNGQSVSNSASYKLDEQESIDYEKKKLQERSQRYSAPK